MEGSESVSGIAVFTTIISVYPQDYPQILWIIKYGSLRMYIKNIYIYQLVTAMCQDVGQFD